MWDDATKSLLTLRPDMHNAASLIRQTRSNKKTVQKEKLQAEFVSTCNTVADDMEARFGPSDHDVIAVGLQALVPTSDTLFDPQSIVPFAKLFRVATNESLLRAQLLTARSMLAREEPAIHSLMELGDYVRSYSAFDLVLECIAVAITIPVSSCSAERCFSAVKRIMTRLRTSMSDERLTDLTILSTHR
jgi:phosphotransferase system IIB component